MPSRYRIESRSGIVSLFAFSLLVGVGSVGAGFIGSLTGLGGGVILVPLLALGFGVDMRYAIGASLISVIATSSPSLPRCRAQTSQRVRTFMPPGTRFSCHSHPILTSVWTQCDRKQRAGSGLLERGAGHMARRRFDHTSL
jgi:sulfite exporter TauE/SafE